MAEINFVILGIIILFFILLAIKGIVGKNKVKNNFCVICVSISLTWIILLVLYQLGLFNNILIISLLIGMSVTGIYYLVESKIGEMNKLKIFRLPFILTLIITAYYILTLEKIFSSILIVVSLWFFFFLIYFHQKIDAPPRLKRRGLIGARFLDARSVPHTKVYGFQTLRHNNSKFTKKLLECCKE